MTADAPCPEQLTLTDAIARLEESQHQITRSIALVHAKIYELETAYLEETLSGNVVKGWEIDGRPPLHKTRVVEDKERLFSFSSAAYFAARKSEEASSAAAGGGGGGAQQVTKVMKKKWKKRKMDEDWNEDYFEDD